MTWEAELRKRFDVGWIRRLMLRWWLLRLMWLLFALLLFPLLLGWLLTLGIGVKNTSS